VWEKKEVIMHHQGRLSKVMLALVVAMTCGALILLALEGKPIQPMPFSLSSQGQLTDIEAALDTDIPIQPGRWRRIDVSYRAVPGILLQNGLAGELALRYHFVIPNDEDPTNSCLCSSPRWTKQMPCIPPPNGLLEEQTIKICLLTGNPGQPASTSNQVRQLQILVDYLIKDCHIEPNLVWMPD
jgi:hypothetical protein